MRISDWSSDVCSSDLADKANAPFARREPRLDAGAIHQHHPCAVFEYDLAGRIVSDDRLGAAIAEQHPRSEERRVGKECVSTCRSRWSPYAKKNNTIKQNNILLSANSHTHIRN